jgi:hypothetical protein
LDVTVRNWIRFARSVSETGTQAESADVDPGPGGEHGRRREFRPSVQAAGATSVGYFFLPSTAFGGTLAVGGTVEFVAVAPGKALGLAPRPCALGSTEMD